jgi:class 3 adenylate cyclase
MTLNRRSLLFLLPPLLMLFLPIGALNLGRKNLSERLLQRSLLRQSEEAEEILAAMGSSCDFPAQMRFLGSQLRTELQELYSDPLPPGKKASLLKSLHHRRFRPPFPKHRLLILEFSSSDPDSLPIPVLAVNAETFGRRPAGLAFRHLVTNACGRDESKADARIGTHMVQALFGKQMIPEILFQDQIGRPTPVIHAQERNFLLWDYISDSAGKPLAGFLLLVPNNDRADQAAFRLALSERNPRVHRGFLRFHPSRFGDFFQKRLADFPGFRSWLKQFRKTNSLRTLERKPRSVVRFPLDNGTIFMGIIPGSTHLAITLLPPVSPPEPLPWLTVVNIFFSLGLLLVVSRGILLGQWPPFRLQGRFIGLFLLAAAFPLFSAGTLASLLLEEKRDALLLTLKKKLQSELMAIDLGEDRKQADVIRAFQNILRDDRLVDCLRKKALNDPRALDLISSHFDSMGKGFPHPLIGLYDLQGKELIRSGTTISPTNKASLLKFFRSAIVFSLWKVAITAPNANVPKTNPLKSEDMMFLEAFQGGSGIRVENMFGEFRDFVTNFNVGREHFSKLHQYVPIDRVDQYAIMLLWRNADFVPLALQEAFEEFLRVFPDGSFMAFRRSRSTLEAQLREDRHSQHLRSLVEAQGAQAIEQVHHDEKARRLLIIQPSKRHADQVFACSIDTTSVESQVWELASRYLAAFVVWVFSTIALLFVSVRRIIRPISRLTGALQEVSRGNLEMTLKLDRRDELGELSDTFDQMISGLQRRRRLSTIVSQKAQEDLFTASPGNNRQSGAYRTVAVTLVSDIRSFTTICESRTTREVTSLLNRHFETMAGIITSHRGRVDKFIGDAIQAIFEDDQAGERAVSAGIAMLKQLEVLNRERILQGSFPYSAGVGLAIGPVFIGGFGDTALRFDYSVMGAPMKEAAHLENLSKQVPYFPLVLSPRLANVVHEIFPRLHPLPGFESEAMVFPRDFDDTPPNKAESSS